MEIRESESAEISQLREEIKGLEEKNAETMSLFNEKQKYSEKI